MTRAAVSRWLWPVLLLLVLGLGSCSPSAPTDAVVTPDGQTHVWEPMYQGVALVSIKTEQPRPLRVYALRVDLHEAGIGFLVTPAHDLVKRTMLSMNTSTFLEKYGCQAAINGSPFAPVVKEEGLSQTVVGLHLSEGTLSSPPDKKRGMLLITKDNKVTIARPPVSLLPYHHGLGGFDVILEEGKIVPINNNDQHPRTAAGLCQQQRYFYLMVIDGRQPGFSEGTTLVETAAWLQLLGGWSGLNLDGGGSTTLVVADHEGKAQLINTPIDRGLPGTQRPSANHLGIFARPLPVGSR